MAQSESMDGQPLVTFAIFAYNHERFISEAIRGAFSQRYSPLEIIISDDCSTDRTFDLIRQEVAHYEGTHQIQIRKNEINLGVSSHINNVMQVARGQLIVVAAGDDVSLPDRVKKTYAAYKASDQKAMSVFSNAIVIDENGNREDLFLVPPGPNALCLVALAKGLTGVLGCAHAWDKRVFDVFGPLHADVTREDVVIPFRSALLGNIAFIREPLVLYRRHGKNLAFGDTEEIKDRRELYSKLSMHADGNVAALRNRLTDLETICRLEPWRENELRQIRSITCRVLKDFEYERELIWGLAFVKRLVFLGRALLQGTPPRRISRWLLTYFLPGIYLRHQAYLRTKTRQQRQKGEPL